MDELLRLPPQNLEAEESVLVSCLLDTECMNNISDIINQDDFYKSGHGKIYGACVSLFKKSEPIDLVSVANYLKENNQLEEVGGGTFLYKITQEFPIGVDSENAAKIIKSKSILRKTIQLANTMAKRCFDNSEDPSEILNGTIKELSTIEQTLAGGNKWLKIGDILDDRVSEYEEMHAKGQNVTGVPSGYRDLDFLTSGFQPADFIILAARPSMGKTSFALNIADNISDQSGVGIFSLEQPINQLFDRSVSSRARVNMQRIRTGKFSNQDWVNMTDAMGGLDNSLLWVDDSPGLHFSEIRRRARHLVRKTDIKIFFIDYLQLCHGDGPVESNECITSISRAFKEMAKELQVPVVALSQLNRKLEDRSGDNKRPRLADLRGSGSLEQDADVVMFLYRDEVYNKDPNNPKKGTGELIISKQRNGPTGNIKLTWLEQFTRFESMAWGTN